MFNNSFDIYLALDCVKKLNDNNCCTVCDKAVEQLMRYSCGHIACDVCISRTEHCMFCLTPPEKKSSNKSLLDEISTQRAINASVLLNVFEKAFNVDVYKHRKMSDQLKIEKDLFPECIQAPNKYFNKRKSSNTYPKKKKKELCKLPGELIYPAERTRIANSINSVEQWLSKNKKNEDEAILGQKAKNENEESGIDIDTSIIDCSQVTENKDEQALLAIYEADKNEQISDSVLTIESMEWGDDNEITREHQNTLIEEYKVPFIKKSKLAESYRLYENESSIINISTSMFDGTKNIQISFFNNNKSLKSNEFVKKMLIPTHTISVQTDISGISHLKENIYLKDANNLEKSLGNNSECLNFNMLSQDVFTSAEKHTISDDNSTNIDFKTATKSIVIKESDSEDGSVTEAEILEVSAQVHRFEHPVLSDITYIDSHEEFNARQMRKRRRLTPDSSNSSEKENLNPNRQKRTKYAKKFKK